MVGIVGQQVNQQQQGQANAAGTWGSMANAVLSLTFPCEGSHDAFITRLPQWVLTPCGAVFMVEVTLHHDATGARLDVVARGAQASRQQAADALDDDDACDYLY